MTEIPEHLLKRSKERRSAIGGDDAPADDAPAAAAAPAPETAPAVPAAAAAEVEKPAPAPEPVRPEVAAALRRRKIPYWAMPVLAGLPLWAYVYQGTLSPPPAGIEGAMAVGQEVYNACSACHGGDGGGIGSFPALTDVLEVFPDGRDQMAWVALGSTGWRDFSDTYGATDKPVGGGMPSFAASLSEEELASVILYERVTFGGLEEGSEEYVLLEAIAEGETTLEAEGVGPEAEEAGIDATTASGS